MALSCKVEPLVMDLPEGEIVMEMNGRVEDEVPEGQAYCPVKPRPSEPMGASCGRMSWASSQDMKGKRVGQSVWSWLMADCCQVWGGEKSSANQLGSASIGSPGVDEEVEAVVGVVIAKVPGTVGGGWGFDVEDGADGAAIAAEADEAVVEPPIAEEDLAQQAMAKKTPTPGATEAKIATPAPPRRSARAVRPENQYAVVRECQPEELVQFVQEGYQFGITAPHR